MARYGEEEFVLILSGTKVKDAERIAEDVRRSVIGLGLSHPASKVSELVTVSIDVASVLPSKQGSKGQLIKAADDSMYLTKKLCGML